MNISHQHLVRIVATVALTTLAVTAFSLLAEGSAPDTDPVPFTDIKSHTLEFIGYQKSIQLTAEQEEIKREALEAIPAPCCNDNTAYTCCCPCNMSLAIWGLSHLLITEHGYNAVQLKAKVENWIKVINPDGFSGNVCYTGGCARPFKHNGCGGMRPGHVTWGEDS